jgi:uncharacterized RDD family membrane protein YckC
MKKNRHTCKWRVDFKDLAYDGGGASSWTQFYWTWIGARWSMFWNLHISSWGGVAILTRTEK